MDLTQVRGLAEHHLFSQTVTNSLTGETGRSIGGVKEYVNTTYLGADYGLTSRLALNGDLAYVYSKFTSDFQEQRAESSVDDGQYHGTLQDFRLEARYAAVQAHNIRFTPFLGVVVPTHHYEDVGHAAPGRNLFQVPVGFNAGYAWPFEVHTTYIAGRFAYSYLRHHEFHFYKSNASLEVGTFLTRHLRVHGDAGWEKTHGGVDWATDITTEEIFEVHDARTSSRYWAAGLGLSYDTGRSTAVSAFYSKILNGQNVVDTRSIGVALSWYFGNHSATTPQQARQQGPQVARNASFEQGL